MIETIFKFREKEQSAKDTEYIKELKILLVEEGKNILMELENTKNQTFKLIESIGGKEKLVEFDRFLANKIYTTLDEIEKDRSSLKKQCNKEILRLKDMIDIVSKISSGRKLTLTLREYNSRIKEEKIANNL